MQHLRRENLTRKVLLDLALPLDFGWPAGEVIDLGGVSGARASEMYSRMLFTFAGIYGTFDLNIAVVRA